MADNDFQSFIDEVLMRNDIVEIISGYTVLKRSGSGMMGLCPLHNDRKSPSLSVSPDKQIFHCFGCGAGGNAINFIQSAMNLDFMDALKYLADRVNLEMPKRRGGADKQKQLAIADKRKKIYEINAVAARYFYNCLADGENPGIRYLLDRMINNKTIRKFGLGYAPEGWKNLINYLKKIGYTENDMYDAGLVKRRDDGSYYDAFYDGRVIFPILDVRGNVIAFGGRVIRDGTDAPKYWNTPETLVFKKKDNLFGLNIAKDAKSGRLLLMEGYMDVVMLHQSGYDSAVASLGTAFTEEQARLVKRYAPRVVLCYDSDEAGKKATIRAGDILYDAGVKVRVLTVTDGKDPDEFIKVKGAEMFGVLIEESKPYIDYKIDEARKRFSGDDIDDQSDFLEEVMNILAKIKNDAQRELYLVRVAGSMQLDPNSLRSGISDRIVKANKQVLRRGSEPAVRRSGSATVRFKESESRYNTERLLLSLMIDKKVMKEVVGAGLSPDDFRADDVHRRLASCMFEMSADGSFSQAEILSMLSPEESSRASAIFLSDKETKDKVGEAKKLIKQMIALRLEDESAKVSGDYEEMNRLLHEMINNKASKNQTKNGGEA